MYPFTEISFSFCVMDCLGMSPCSMNMLFRHFKLRSLTLYLWTQPYFCITVVWCSFWCVCTVVCNKMFQVLTFVGNQHMNRCASKGCFKMSYDVFWNLLLVHFSKSCMSTVVWRVAWKSELDSCGFLLVKMKFWNCLEELTPSITWTLSLFPWEIRLSKVSWWSWRKKTAFWRGRKERKWKSSVWFGSTSHSSLSGSYDEDRAVLLPTWLLTKEWRRCSLFLC